MHDDVVVVGRANRGEVELSGGDVALAPAAFDGGGAGVLRVLPQRVAPSGSGMTDLIDGFADLVDGGSRDSHRGMAFLQELQAPTEEREVSHRRRRTPRRGLHFPPP